MGKQKAFVTFVLPQKCRTYSKDQCVFPQYFQNGKGFFFLSMTT